MKTIKIWLTRRWLDLIPLEELQEHVESRYWVGNFDTFYEKAFSAMVENFSSNPPKTTVTKSNQPKTNKSKGAK